MRRAIKKKHDELIEDLRYEAEKIVSLLERLEAIPSAPKHDVLYEKHLAESISMWSENKKKRITRTRTTDVDFLKIFYSILEDHIAYTDKSGVAESNQRIVLLEGSADKVSLFFENWKPQSDTDYYVLNKVKEARNSQFLVELCYGIVKREREKALERLKRDFYTANKNATIVGNHGKGIKTQRGSWVAPASEVLDPEEHVFREQIPEEYESRIDDYYAVLQNIYSEHSTSGAVLEMPVEWLLEVFD